MSDFKDIPDHELFSRCILNEDAKAWDLFFRKYSSLLRSSINRTFRSYSFHYASEDAEDAFSSLFLSLIDNNFKKFKQFQGRNGCSLSTWLTVVAVRHAIDYMRKQKKLFTTTTLEDADQIVDSADDGNRNVETVLMEQQISVALKKIIAGLTPQEGQLFDLLYQHCLAPEEAAKALGVSVSALYTRKHRLNEKIKKIINSL